MNVVDRRSFLAATAWLAAAGAALAQPARRRERRGPSAEPPVVIASGNGLECVKRAYALIEEGADPAHAVVRGVEINENDPDDMTVGLGGLPNEDGVVSLDAAVMHGPTHRAGAVAALEGIRNPAAVALEVARRTDHVMLVGEGAKRFALRLGFTEENLLTERARREWLRWKAEANRRDDWLEEDEWDLPAFGEGARGARPARTHPPLPIVEPPTGTIHCSALTPERDLAGCTTTSGLFFKLPGRVGDSPIIGAGCYTDNAIGSAGGTGRGEAVIQTCGAHTIVMRMGAGDHPTDACLHALRQIAERTRAKRLLNEKGEPDFNVVYYAVRKDGAFGSACMRGGRQYAVCTPAGAELRDCAALFEG